MKLLFHFSFVCLVLGGCFHYSIFSQVIHVAPYDAPDVEKSASDFVCTGTHDEVLINQAISRLYDEHEELLSEILYLGLDLTDTQPWKPTGSDTSLELFQGEGGPAGLRIQGTEEPYPGLELAGLKLDLEPFESFDVLVHSHAAIKIRMILTDSSQQEVRYHEKVPSPGSWQRLRFYLSQPYSGTANLSDITAIRIQATSELDGLEYSIGQAGFTRSLNLAHGRIHPDSLQARSGQRALEMGVDFDIDVERGKVWLFNSQDTTVRYRHGGGTVQLAAGNYQIDDALGIELRSYCELKLHGAILTAADSLDAPGQLIQTASNALHTHVSIRGGQLRGQRMQWPTQQNISGIVLRDTSNVIIDGCEVSDFNSAGIAVVNTHYKDSRFPKPQRVTIANSRIARCATEYVDIRGDKYGEVGKGADHKAMLRLAGIRDFEIRNNRIEDSFGDAKWVVGCEDGIITGNTIENSRMGSYFVEGSVRVIGNANLIRNSGSRAVTIERGSHENTFCNNVILNSYREGLWLMGCSECLIQGNRFENNGWRNSDGLDSAIKIEWLKSFASDKASFNLITHNIIKTQPHQDHAIWIASGENSKGNVISDNLIIGSKLAVRDEGVETIVERNQLR
jgi:parallel beta-helix repeat protein